jgi:hypothetical protein
MVVDPCQVQSPNNPRILAVAHRLLFCSQSDGEDDSVMPPDIPWLDVAPHAIKATVRTDHTIGGALHSAKKVQVVVLFH